MNLSSSTPGCQEKALGVTDAMSLWTQTEFMYLSKKRRINL